MRRFTLYNSSMDRYLLAGLLGFGLGVFLYSYVPLGWSGVLLSLLLAAAVLVTKKRTAVTTLIAIALACVALGEARLLVTPTHLPEAFTSSINTDVAFDGIVVVDPDLREETQRLTVEVTKEGVTTRILAVAPLFPHVAYGDHLHIEGLLELPEPFDTDNGRTFRYDTFLAKDGVFAIMHEAHIRVEGHREGIAAHIFGFFTDLKNAGLQALSAALPEPAASLAGGLILGGKQGLGEKLLQDFVRSGLVHIVVLSGYNVMIVAEFVLRALGKLSKRKAAIAAAFTIAGFVLVAGAGAASVRAGIMACIALYARASGHTYNALRALLFAGLLMILWNPLSLAYDPGFQLSFLATLGLIFGAPIAQEKLSFIRSDFLREIVASTIAAQIAVLPLLLYQNGLFSVVALPANLLVLPMVPLAMLASAIAMLVGFVAPLLAPIAGLPAYALLSYIIWLVQMTSSLPLATLSIPAFPAWVMLLAYVALIVGYRKASCTRPSTTVQFTLSKNAST